MLKKQRMKTVQMKLQKEGETDGKSQRTAARMETEAENEAESERSPIAPDCRGPFATLEY